ncbi:MarR family winged helix-turn-helix transcriptional regulator [Noviherbaspirillum humi]|nr:MarR family transcriptional regulator [Noviherbaspirillum humi]
MASKKQAGPGAGPQKPSGVAYLIGRLDHVLNKRMRDALAPIGLTVPHYTALSVFRSLGSISNAQLAERTMVSPQSANEMVKALEAKGWIGRAPDPSHGRIIQISLTEAGEEVLRRCDGEVAAIERLMFHDMGEEEQALLYRQLRAAVRSLSLHGI